MSRPRRGVDRVRAKTHDELFDAATANDERATKLLSNSLRRRAHALGLKLRHSDLGYSLVDLDGNRVDERNDLTLAEIGAALDARPETAQRGARKRG